MQTLVAFPNSIRDVTGISYMRIGPRKVIAVLSTGGIASIKRSAFPPILPEGNSLAFEALRLMETHDWSFK